MSIEHIPIELTLPDSNPIVVAIDHNEAMGAYDVHVFVGNFKTEEEAVDAATVLVQMMERELGIGPAKVARDS